MEHSQVGIRLASQNESLEGREGNTDTPPPPPGISVGNEQTQTLPRGRRIRSRNDLGLLGGNTGNLKVWNEAPESLGDSVVPRVLPSQRSTGQRGDRHPGRPKRRAPTPRSSATPPGEPGRRGKPGRRRRWASRRRPTTGSGEGGLGPAALSSEARTEPRPPPRPPAI